MPTARHIRGLLRNRQLSASDIQGESILHVVTVRSEKAHARIIRVRPPVLPDGVSYIDAKALSPRAAVRIHGDSLPVLSSDVVRYVGEPIGLLVGPEREQLLALRGDFRVTYEEYEPCFSLDTPDEEAIHLSSTATRGSVDEAFEAAPLTIERTVNTGIQEHFYPDAHSAFAAYRQDGRIDVTCATQWPFHVRRTIAESIGTVIGRVRVYAVEPGPALDGKMWFPSLVATHAALASRRTRRSCLLRYDRSEDIHVSPKRAGALIKGKLALDEKGSMTAIDVHLDYDAGAYPLLVDESVRRLLAAGLGSYSCEHARVTVRAIRTNSVPNGPATGIEAPMWYGCEELAAAAIRETESDPIDWKARHLLRPGSKNHIGEEPAEENTLPQLMEIASKASDFRRKFAAFELQRKHRESLLGKNDLARGVGIAVGSQGTGFSGYAEEQISSTVRLELDDEGGVWLYTSSRPASAALQAVWKETLARELDVEPDMVRFASCDTDTVPDSGPSIFSRAVSQQTRLIEQACNALLSKRFEQALPISVRRSYRRPRKQQWNTETQRGTPFAYRSFAAAVVEVEVDPTSFEPIVRGVWVAVDAGRLLDEVGARQSMLSSIGHALTWSARDPIGGPGLARRIDGGGNFAPPFRHEPPLSVHFLDEDQRSGDVPLGIGELPYFCVPAAFAQATEQATGAKAISLPASPSSIYAALVREQQ